MTGFSRIMLHILSGVGAVRVALKTETSGSTKPAAGGIPKAFTAKRARKCEITGVPLS